MTRSNALYRANQFVTLYGVNGDTFVPLGPKCELLRVARKYQLNTLTVALAASFFQRLELPSGMDRFVRHRPGHRTQPLVFECTLHNFVPVGPDDYDWPVDWPAVVLTCCLHLAVKLTHVPRNSPAKLGGYSLRYMLLDLLGNHPRLCDLQELEITILRQLDMRLVDGSLLLKLHQDLDRREAARREPSSKPDAHRPSTKPSSPSSPCTVLYCMETLSPSPSP